MRKILSILFLLVLSQSVDLHGQQPPDTVNAEANQAIIDAIDSLTNVWFRTKSLQSGPEPAAAENQADVPVFPDSVYYERLNRIPSPIQLVYNNIVRQYIDLYTLKKRQQVNYMLGLASYYFPVFEEALDRYNLPLELKYLPIIESALNPHAVSRAGATGLWQFMYTTGRMYGLKINSYVDERRDPYLATDAAARFLKDLYDLYGDWSLVLAAYNSGPGNVNKAIRRSGGKTDYWAIRKYLPRETRGYVPAFIAATYVMSYYREHNLHPVHSELFDIVVDTVHINRNISLRTIADSIGMDVEDLTFLNPALKRQEIALSNEPYALRLPAAKVPVYEAKKENLFKNTLPVRFASHEEKIPAETNENPEPTATQNSYHYSYQPPDLSNKTKLVYTVKSGDNLSYIAEWYDCKVSDLKWWNNIRGTTIRVGQKLTVYVPKDQLARYRNIDNLSFEQKQAADSKTRYTGTSGSSATRSNKPVKYMYYTIKPGDTLWDIANKYPKNTVEDIKRINNITDLKSIKPGVVIKIII